MQDTTLTVAGKAAQLDPAEFGEWFEERQRAVSNILETIKEQVVEQQIIEPLVGARIASCVVGSVFGYEEFHPRTGQPQAEQLLEMFEPALAGANASHR